MDQPNRPDNPRPGEHFRTEMADGAHAPGRVARLVRLAFGEPPPGLDGNRPDGPEEAEVRADARAALLAEGWLTEAEIEALPAEEADAVVRRRFGERRVDPDAERHAG